MKLPRPYPSFFPVPLSLKPALITLVAALLCSPLSHAADKTRALADADIDRIVNTLESSGKLDAALERSMQRMAKKQQDAKRQQQEAQLAQQKELSKNVKKPVPASEHLYGAADAEVTLIEFSDYECPFCKRFHGTPEKVVDQLAGRANLIWRHFPLEFHNPAATIEAEASECVTKLGGNSAFWQYSNTLIARTISNGKGMPVTVPNEHPLITLAGELKLDKDAFKACMDAGTMKEHVAGDMADGINSGVEGTPAIILYHHKTGKTDFIGGAVSADKLEAAVRKMLAE